MRALDRYHVCGGGADAQAWIRRAVCRCFLGAVRSATNIWAMTDRIGSSFGACATRRLRGAGTADASAWRTVRR
ncbi:hypothetical protein GCM10022225_25480 [Plantactinospora mayteni]|uniref:Uncharacterized protein n=1 Tax=Plantactinospora mayteni TaxID=566021 RepID=A0ABQ4EIZ2_9ACTN|nr:hypothetical protein [Plantactinospora mayteni]GIG94722.1 hypothetical protein Pma05_12950 [Plantactinospora mayteni]